MFAYDLIEKETGYDISDSNLKKEKLFKPRIGIYSL
jgi:hypothetical protein